MEASNNGWDLRSTIKHSEYSVPISYSNTSKSAHIGENVFLSSDGMYNTLAKALNSHTGRSGSKADPTASCQEPPALHESSQLVKKTKPQQAWTIEQIEFMMTRMAALLDDNNGKYSCGADYYRAIAADLEIDMGISRTEGAVKNWWTRTGRGMAEKRYNRSMEERRPTSNGAPRALQTSRRSATRSSRPPSTNGINVEKGLVVSNSTSGQSQLDHNVTGQGREPQDNSSFMRLAQRTNKYRLDMVDPRKHRVAPSNSAERASTENYVPAFPEKLPTSTFSFAKPAPIHTTSEERSVSQEQASRGSLEQRSHPPNYSPNAITSRGRSAIGEQATRENLEQYPNLPIPSRVGATGKGELIKREPATKGNWEQYPNLPIPSRPQGYYNTRFNPVNQVKCALQQASDIPVNTVGVSLKRVALESAYQRPQKKVCEPVPSKTSLGMSADQSNGTDSVVYSVHPNGIAQGNEYMQPGNTTASNASPTMTAAQLHNPVPVVDRDRPNDIAQDNDSTQSGDTMASNALPSMPAAQPNGHIPMVNGDRPRDTVSAHDSNQYANTMPGHASPVVPTAPPNSPRLVVDGDGTDDDCPNYIAQGIDFTRFTGMMASNASLNTPAAQLNGPSSEVHGGRLNDSAQGNDLSQPRDNITNNASLSMPAAQPIGMDSVVFRGRSSPIAQANGFNFSENAINGNTPLGMLAAQPNTMNSAIDGAHSSGTTQGNDIAQSGNTHFYGEAESNLNRLEEAIHHLHEVFRAEYPRYDGDVRHFVGMYDLLSSEKNEVLFNQSCLWDDTILMHAGQYRQLQTYALSRAVLMPSFEMYLQTTRPRLIRRCVVTAEKLAEIERIGAVNGDGVSDPEPLVIHRCLRGANPRDPSSRTVRHGLAPLHAPCLLGAVRDPLRHSAPARGILLLPGKITREQPALPMEWFAPFLKKV